MSQWDDEPSGPFAEIRAKLDAWIGIGNGIKDGVDKLGRQWKAQPEVISTRVVKQQVSPAAGNFIIGLGGPAMGRRWSVRKIAVGGSLVTSAPAGTGYLLQEPTTPPLIGPMMSFVDVTSGTFPQRAFYGKGELILDDPDKLWLLITSPTAATQYVVTYWVEDYELGVGLAAQML